MVNLLSLLKKVVCDSCWQIFRICKVPADTSVSEFAGICWYLCKLNLLKILQKLKGSLKNFIMKEIPFKQPCWKFNLQTYCCTLQATQVACRHWNFLGYQLTRPKQHSCCTCVHRSAHFGVIDSNPVLIQLLSLKTAVKWVSQGCKIWFV